MKIGFDVYFFCPLLVLLLFQFSLHSVHSCGSRPDYNRRAKKPLYLKQRVPDSEEISLQASGKPQGKITRNSSKFNTQLVACYSTDIVFKDEEKTGADRLMTKRCREKLKILASKVRQRWRGVKLRVTEAWDEDGSHAVDSLHYEGRAVDITTSDKDTKKYPELGRLAVEAGFDWVYYEERHRIHASVRADDDRYDRWGSCFSAHGAVILESGTKIALKDLKTGEKVQALDQNGELVFSEVLMFLDYNPWLNKVPFIVIETEATNTRLALTKNHLVFALEGNSTIEPANAKLAKNVQPGEYVLVRSKAGPLVARKVTAVRREDKNGVIAPLTVHGTILVDGVAASCYSEVTSHSISHVAFAPVRWLHSLAPKFLKDLDISGNQKGTHWFPRFLIMLNRLLGVVEFA